MEKIKAVFVFTALICGFALSVSLHAAGMDTVSVRTTSGDVAWTVDLASNGETRATGLMHRQSLPDGTGMLFRFDQTRPVSMWMKNTFVPLDMVFADESGLITHIHRGAVPQSLDIISSRGPVRYVLEIIAGAADRHGLAVGQRMRHPWILPVN